MFHHDVVTQVFCDWRNGRSLCRSRPTYCIVPSSSFSISVVAQLVRAYDQPVKSTSSLRWSGRRLSRLQIRQYPPRLASNALKTSLQPPQAPPLPSRENQQPKPPSMQQECPPPGQISDGPLRPPLRELASHQHLRRSPAKEKEARTETFRKRSPSRTCLP